MGAVIPSDVVADLATEHHVLDAVLAGLSPAAWDLPTPAPGWTVRDQVSHLAFSEELAATAVVDRAAFQLRLGELLADLEAAEQEPRERGRSMPPGDLLGWWRAARSQTLERLQERDAVERVPWVTGEMSAASFATARLMETWAHGHDVHQAVGRPPAVSERLRHVAHLGVRTRAFSYQVRGLAVPSEAARVELDAPDGTTWVWGPPSAPDRVRGPALDFCLVVTRRRAVADTSLVAEGGAVQWLTIAQAFAGPPTEAPAPRDPVRRS